MIRSTVQGQEIPRTEAAFRKLIQEAVFHETAAGKSAAVVTGIILERYGVDDGSQAEATEIVAALRKQFRIPGTESEARG